MFQIAMVLEDPPPDQISGSTQLIIPLVGLMEPGSLNRSSNVVEAIRNEIDKERIRKEIIAEEVARKQMLELEVRRELMMEREIAMFGEDRFASFFKNQADSVLFKEKIGMGISVVSRHDMDHFSEVPFCHRVVEPIISTVNQSPKVEILQVQPPGVGGLLLAKPDTIFSGPKRKAITLIEAVADKASLSSAPVKIVTEWSCALCQIFTTNKDCLNIHFQGKKHKRKEAAFREHKDDRNCRIGFFSKKPKLMQLVERPCDDLISGKKSEKESSSPNDNDPPSLLIDDSANDLRKNTAHEKQTNGEFKFWCDTCKIGTFSEKVMETHKVAKKHARHLQQLFGKDKDAEE
ncbi:hypothetical protein KY290_026810 [Solanum tuberosum]|uniref:U1-type domain-containing protein n=2 Tax=Solanum tuberosum TaxID=4113 RepID=A0ABQ7UXJ2_SOLTU|nr:hypothetical protein KY285_024847 [Solanum tuberosum]KAH0756540.1 hypothetical protein KY290_026810 [Solanum tuberosum]